MTGGSLRSSTMPDDSTAAESHTSWASAKDS
jgi:hypothetical protein